LVCRHALYANVGSYGRTAPINFGGTEKVKKEKRERIKYMLVDDTQQLESPSPWRKILRANKGGEKRKKLNWSPRTV